MTPEHLFLRSTPPRVLLPLRCSLLVALVALAGCGSSGLTTVSGTVKLDGKPLDGASVTFQPVKAGPVGTATTAADGSFTVMTGAQKGLAPGEYEVSVVKTGPLPPPTPQNPEPIPPRITPDKYASGKTSGFKYTVPGGAANFELSSK